MVTDIMATGGVLYNKNTVEISLAPVFDCGSCLFPKATILDMETALSDISKIDDYIYQNTLSCIWYNNQKINYFNFISLLKNKDCIEALKRIISKINMNEIINFINEITCINDIQKKFYIKILSERKAKILDYSLNLLK